MLITILVVLLLFALFVWLVQRAPAPSPDFPTATVKWIVIAIGFVIAAIVILNAAHIHLP